MDRGVWTVTKADLIDRLAEQTGLSKSLSERFLNATLDIIQKAVSTGDEVKLVDFGTFESLKRKPRKGRNPRTGQSVAIPATVVPRFRPGKEFRQLVTRDS